MSHHPSTDRPTPLRRRRVRALLAVIGMSAVALLASACDLSQLVLPSSSTSRGYGRGPVQAVADAAEAWQASAKRDPNPAISSCDLISDNPKVRVPAIVAMVLTPTLLESGDSSPSPMTLSRWDNIGVNAGNVNLYPFSDPRGPYVEAFFSPGIGLWQFDSAGGWNLTASDAIDVNIAGPAAVDTMARRYCTAAAGSTQEERRLRAWSPWACSRSDYLGTDRGCEAKYQSLLNAGRIDVNLNSSIDATGGMLKRSCSLKVLAEPIECWYVDPANAQGSRGWTQWGPYDPNSVRGVTPLPKPFYVFRLRLIDGRDWEFRVWLRQDTGYPIDITARHPVTTNARSSMVWSQAATICDTYTRRGDCDRVGPTAALDSVSQTEPAKVRVAGWAFDRDSAEAIPVKVSVDGALTATITANGSRPDVDDVYPGAGDDHGFIAQIPVAAGSRQVCLDAVDVGGGPGDLRIGCSTITVSGMPRGSIDSAVAGPGRVTVGGWSAVPGLPDAPALVSIDGGAPRQVTRSITRSDVAAAYPWSGTTTGFTTTFTGLSGGAHRVCLTSGLGAPDALGCRTVTLPTGAPFGSFDLASGGPGSITVGGWAIDPDTGASIAVHFYLGTSFRSLTADATRADVGAAYPGYGSAHGFSRTFLADARVLGRDVNVCAYAIDVGGTTNTLLGCRAVRLPTGSPIGRIERLERTASGLAVSGWAIDPDTKRPIPVHVYVGAAGSAIDANGARPDVRAAFRAYGLDYGDPHGYSAVVPIPSGPTQVCVYGIESAGTGSNALLGCRTL